MVSLVLPYSSSRSCCCRPGIVRQTRLSFGATRNVSTGAIQQRLVNLMKGYEEVVGLTSIRDAQSEVIKAETRFLSVQHDRRNHQRSLLNIQDRLRQLNSELEKIPRSDDKYLQLLTEEHSYLKKEQDLVKSVEALEQTERDRFSLLSTALRDSHDKERAHSERTKYWSITGSCIGAAIGVLGTTINNSRRMNQLKQILLMKQGETTPELHETLTEMTATMSALNEVLESTQQRSKESEQMMNGECDSTTETIVSQTDTIGQNSEMILAKITATEQNIYRAVISGIVSCSLFLLSIAVLNHR